MRGAKFIPESLNVPIGVSSRSERVRYMAADSDRSAAIGQVALTAVSTWLGYGSSHEYLQTMNLKGRDILKTAQY